MIGQTAEIAPADKKLYALRDVTATVESPYLICASIMSKKMAEGIDALVLDVKTGDGAFMKKRSGRGLSGRIDGRNRQAHGQEEWSRSSPIWTSRSAAKSGNALEVEECIEMLNGRGRPIARTVYRSLRVDVHARRQIQSRSREGRALAAEMIASGRARDTFREIIRLQGGDAGVVDDPGRLPQAHHGDSVTAQAPDSSPRFSCEQVGVASMMLGGGREKKEDAIDPAVGPGASKKAWRPGEIGRDTLHRALQSRRHRLAEVDGIAGEEL